MCRGFYLTMLLLCIPLRNTLALSIGYDGSSTPFIVTYQQGMQASFEPILQILNDAQGSVNVVAWQLDRLEVRSMPGTQGGLLITSADIPPDCLFGQEPRQISDLTSPSDSLLASDADLIDVMGKTVSAGMARNILRVTLVATPDAAGTFQLVMPEFDPGQPESGPSWLAADVFEPMEFENSAVSGLVLLGTIQVTQAAGPGDYDSDGVVGPSDYDRWRAHFGNSVGTPGEDADGNRNMIIDAADYVIWRANAGTGNASGSGYFTEQVPEPGSLYLTVLCLVGGSGWRCRRPC